MNSEDFYKAIVGAGLESPGPIMAGGKIHRFHVEGDRKGSENGWYVFFEDPPSGAFGCWKRGISETWTGKLHHALSPAEKTSLKAKMKAARAEREREQAKVQAEARKLAVEIWAPAAPAPATHPYLAAKDVKGHGVRISRGNLIVPLRDTTGSMQGLQFINPDGAKKYLTGTDKTGHYFAVGIVDIVLHVCEGYATGESIFQATGGAVAVAFDAGNLLPVAKALRQKFPNLKIIVCADNDQWTEGNPGLAKASNAAEAVDGLLASPVFSDIATRPTDFNDLYRLEGPEEVRRQIEAAAPPPNQSMDIEGLEVLRGCDVRPEPIQWLWIGWLAVGKLEIMGGAPGTGKTTLALSLGATLTIGGQWPDGTKALIADIAIWSGEDDPQDTLAPRLLAAGADMGRIHFIRGISEEGQRRQFDPARDMDHLDAYLRKHPEIKLLIVDPVVSAVSGDSHKNTEVRRNLQPLVDLGASCGCAVLGITHFSKGTSGRDPVERITGSIAFGALARIVLAAAKLADDEDGKRLFARSKSNIGPDEGGWHYRLETVELSEYPGVITSKMSWCGAVEGSARDLLSTAEVAENSEDRSAKTEAMDFLREALNDGPAPARRIVADAKANGIASRTLTRAKKDLEIEVKKIGMGGGWVWSLPAKVAMYAEEGQQNLTATFGDVGNLRDSSSEGSRVIQLSSDDFEEVV